ERYMRVQIEESVYYLFTWTQGTFNFEADVRPERQDFLVSINPESLLLEGARRVDEWSLIEKKMPSFDLIFVLDKDRLAISVAELRSGEPNAHFYIGLVALKQARWREAMEALRLAAEKGGGRPAVFHNLGFAYEQLGRLDEAEAAYGEAATRARTDAKVYLG